MLARNQDIGPPPNTFSKKDCHRYGKKDYFISTGTLPKFQPVYPTRPGSYECRTLQTCAVYTKYKLSLHKKYNDLGGLGHLKRGQRVEIDILKHAIFRISATFRTTLHHCARGAFLGVNT